MKAKELRQLNQENLRLREQETREELFSLRFQFAAGDLANHARLNQTRRDLAKIKTVLREKKDE